MDNNNQTIKLTEEMIQSLISTAVIATTTALREMSPTHQDLTQKQKNQNDQLYHLEVQWKNGDISLENGTDTRNLQESKMMNYETNFLIALISHTVKPPSTRSQFARNSDCMHLFCSSFPVTRYCGFADIC